MEKDQNDPLESIFKRFLLHKVDATYPSDFPPDQILNKKTLIFDLDETLIHSSVDPPRKNVKAFQTGKPPFYVFKRPGLDDFLAKYSKEFDIFIFTSSDRDYADAIINVICPFVDNHHRLYRNSCSIENNVIHKNLDAFKRHETDIILIDDNSELKKFHPNNTIIVPKWDGNPKDTILINWLPNILDKCVKSNDVREIIKNLIISKECK